jgi:hypothetical protein
MLHIESQRQFADAATAIVRAYALATVRAASRSLFQSLSFWSLMLRSSASQPMIGWSAAWAAQSLLRWNPIEGWTARNHALDIHCNAQTHEAEQPRPLEPPADASFATYRSSSGYAVAQVVVADTRP